MKERHMNNRDCSFGGTNLAITYSVFLRALFISRSLSFHSFLTFETLNKNRGLVVRMLADMAHWDFATRHSNSEFPPSNKGTVLSTHSLEHVLALFILSSVPMSKSPVSLNFCFLLFALSSTDLLSQRVLLFSKK